MMTIEVRTGDLLKSQAHALVNTVNCVGIMGKGVALAFKKRYPDMFEDYVQRCLNREVKLGRPYPYAAKDGHLIINFPTKDHWRGVSRINDIIAGLGWLEEHYREWGARSIAVPPLGCGNGQLEWNVVGPTLHRGLSQLSIPVVLYAPLGTPAEQMQLDFFTEPARTLPRSNGGPAFMDPAWVAIAEVVDRIGQRRHHWPVGRVRLQKIAYFLSVLDVPTQLSYERGSYGPYSAELKPITARLINNGLLREKRSGQMIEVSSGPTFDDARSAYADAVKQWDNAIERVTDLFARTSTNESEIAASVHMVAAELAGSLSRTPTEIEVRDGVLQWKERRRPPLKPEAVEAAVETLAVLGWIHVQPSPELRDDDELLVG
jgi:uncharacterized protein YwgA/O-acetyl-ADP-ribose deacetylase (regulator of RNase III)